MPNRLELIRRFGHLYMPDSEILECMRRDYPLAVSLSEYRTWHIGQSMSSKTFYRILRALLAPSRVPGRIPLVSAWKGPWPGPDGTWRRRIVLVFYPVLTWGFDASADPYIRFFQEFMSLGFEPYGLKSSACGT